eukprot:tig00000391_g24845.t1
MASDRSPVTLSSMFLPSSAAAGAYANGSTNGAMRAAAARTLQQFWRKLRLRRSLAALALWVSSQRTRTPGRYFRVIGPRRRPAGAAADPWPPLLASLSASKADAEGGYRELAEALRGAEGAPSVEHQATALQRLADAACNPFLSMELVRLGAVPRLVSVAQRARFAASRRLALRALAAICLDCGGSGSRAPPAASALADASSLDALLVLAVDQSDLGVQGALFALLQAASASRPVAVKWVQQECFGGALVKALSNPFSNNEFRVGPAACLRNCSRFAETFDALLQAGMAKVVVELCLHPHDELSLLGLEIASNLAASREACRELFGAGVLRALEPSLQEPDGERRAFALLALGRIAGNHPASLGKIAHLGPALVDGCAAGGRDARRGAALALASLATSGEHGGRVLSEAARAALLPFTAPTAGHGAGESRERECDRELDAVGELARRALGLEIRGERAPKTDLDPEAAGLGLGGASPTPRAVERPSTRGGSGGLEQVPFSRLRARAL